MTDYSKFSEDELFSEMDLITSELEARLEMDRKEAAEAKENERLLYKTMSWKMPAKRKLLVSDMDGDAFIRHQDRPDRSIFSILHVVSRGVVDPGIDAVEVSSKGCGSLHPYREAVLIEKLVDDILAVSGTDRNRSRIRCPNGQGSS